MNDHRGPINMRQAQTRRNIATDNERDSECTCQPEFFGDPAVIPPVHAMTCPVDAHDN
jgi:hypothetical protein